MKRTEDRYTICGYLTTAAKHGLNMMNAPYATHSPAAPGYPGWRPGPEDLRIGRDGEITSPRYWGPTYQTAAGADLAWRRERDAATAASQDPHTGN